MRNDTHPLLIQSLLHENPPFDPPSSSFSCINTPSTHQNASTHVLHDVFGGFTKKASTHARPLDVVSPLCWKRNGGRKDQKYTSRSWTSFTSKPWWKMYSHGWKKNAFITTLKGPPSSNLLNSGFLPASYLSPPPLHLLENHQLLMSWNWKRKAQPGWGSSLNLKIEDPPLLSFFMGVPERVLDASGIRESKNAMQYLAWSQKNVLAIALDQKVYTWLDGLVECIPFLPLSLSTSTTIFPTSVAFSRTGTHLAIGTNQGDVYVYDLEHQHVQHHFRNRGQKTWVTHLAWTHAWTLAGGESEGKDDDDKGKGHVWCWDTRQAKQSHTFPMSTSCQQVTWDGWNEKLAVVTLSCVSILDVRHLKKKVWKYPDLQGQHVTWSPHWMNVLACSNALGQLDLWDMQTMHHMAGAGAAAAAAPLSSWSSSVSKKSGATNYPHLPTTTTSCSSYVPSTSKVFFDPLRVPSSSSSSSFIYQLHSSPCQLTVYTFPLLQTYWKSPPLSTRALVDACLHPSGDYLATLTQDHNLKFWRLQPKPKATTLSSSSPSPLHPPVTPTQPFPNAVMENEGLDFTSFLHQGPWMKHPTSKCRRRRGGGGCPSYHSRSRTSSSNLLHLKHPYPIR
ncbi:ubiquitin-protein transferase activating protein [Coelomomyces lativittatus]|nr:ubiquitin-protein transferase activating protein [Coelomomyces lativittatus]KAJ1512768.1 ubiquitin-protein transferase activating protein [Coelomomyces lativittatus]KAJ1518507.1 ubiquitin-protein transferase activating protein [Coelomomyces lativittatus]